MGLHQLAGKLNLFKAIEMDQKSIVLVDFEEDLSTILGDNCLYLQVQDICWFLQEKKNIWYTYIHAGKSLKQR